MTYDVPDQTGRLAIVTGANSGLGLETAKRLAGAGAEVIMAVRNLDKGAEAQRGLTGTTHLEQVDVSDLSSVEAFVGRIDRPVDILVLNAGVMAVPERTETVDGFELQLGTNYLGHFALAGRLLPRLKAAVDPVVVSLSSVAHLIGRIDLDDLQGNDYKPWKAYGQSKLAMLILGLHLDRLSKEHGWGVRSNAAHPGFTRTHLQTTGPAMGATGLKKVTAKVTAFGLKVPLIAQDPPQGAEPQLLAATTSETGQYYGPHRLATGRPVKARANGRARDVEVAAALWSESERLTGVTYA